MAAFESTGVLTLKPIRSSTDLVVDLRIAKLPFKRPAAAEDDFDPRNHRHPRVVIKPWMAYLNLMRAAVGIGMLGAPLAISHAGLLFGPFYFLSIGCLLIHTHLTLMMDWSDSTKSLAIMILPTLLLEILMKNLRIISYIVNGGNVINLLGLILVIVQIFRGPRRETHLFPSGWASMLLATGTCLFNLSAVGVILSCEKSLEDPHLMSRSPFGVVRVGLMVPTLVNILMGALGYWSYGRADENILRYLAYDDLVTMAALGLFSVSAIMGYPVFCYPGVQIILEVIMNHDRNVNIQPHSLKQVEFVARPIFVLLTFAIAYYKPYQGPFVAFVGCGCTSLLSLVFPALMEIGLCYPDDYGRFHYILVKDMLIVVMGMIIWTGGLYLWGYLLYVAQSKPEVI